MTNLVEPAYSKNKIRKAGEALGSSTSREDVPEEALLIAQNWRGSHAYPLNSAAMRARARIKSADVNGELVQRLKRMDSIESKLRDGRAKDLSSMQDIAGCRIIVDSVDELIRLKQTFATSKFRVGDPDKYDYVWIRPKTNGYRSIHFVERYTASKEAFQNMKVETQLRTRRMHYWATAVETVDTFFDERLKAGHGDATWGRFFQLSSGVLALDEELPLPPSCPEKAVLKDDLARVERELNALEMMETCRTIVEGNDDKKHGKAFVLRQFQSGDDRAITLSSFKTMGEGLEFYAESEEELGVNSVLVAVEDRDSLRRAYPNYFTDSTDFIRIIRDFLD